MFGPISSSRIAKQNVCFSCLSNIQRQSDLTLRHIRYLTLATIAEDKPLVDKKAITRNVQAFNSTLSVGEHKLCKARVAKNHEVHLNPTSKTPSLSNKKTLAAAENSLKEEDGLKKKKRGVQSSSGNKGTTNEDPKLLMNNAIQDTSQGDLKAEKSKTQNSKRGRNRIKKARGGKKTLARRVLSKLRIDVSSDGVTQAATIAMKKAGKSLGNVEDGSNTVQVPKTKSNLKDSLELGPLVNQTLIHALQNIKLGTHERKLVMGRLRRSLLAGTSSLKAARKTTSPKSKELPARGVGSSPQKTKLKLGMTAYEIKTIQAADLELVPLEKPQPPVPTLAYGLERVLFNPGVYHLRDPRSRVFNFDPYLQSIMPVAEFDFNALKEYVTSSRDETLISTAAAESKKYTGSTSSMTSALAHFHFLLSQWRPVNISSLSQGFPDTLRTFTQLQRAPSAVFLRWRNGTYAIDADKEFDSANILMMLGKSMEKLLTLPTNDFEKYRKENSDQISAEERNEAESFHYTTMGDFLMRSQLDAFDPRIPGTGMFDLKTRAVVSIRMDAQNYHGGMGYEIRNRHGEFESYEREYYDMIRAAFLKYSLQVRMGRMDGIFVAFHNTERIFGFQYISLPEMDLALHGQDDLTIGDSEFKLSLELLNRVLDRATARFPKQSLRLFFETRETSTPFMYIFAEPVTEDQIQEVQESKKAEIEEYERTALGLHRDPTSEEIEQEREKAKWEELQANVEESMNEDELENVDDIGNLEDTNRFGAVLNPPSGPDRPVGSQERVGVEKRTADMIIGAASDRRILNQNNTKQESRAEENLDIESFDEDHRESFGAIGNVNITENGDGLDLEKDHAGGEIEKEHSPVEVENLAAITNGKKKKSAARDNKELLAMTLTIRNKVNGVYVARPENLLASDSWSVEYSLAEVPKQPQSRRLYEATQRRRQRVLKKSKDDSKNNFNRSYAQKLKQLSLQGRVWRKTQNEIDEGEPVKVLTDRIVQNSKTSGSV